MANARRANTAGGLDRSAQKYVERAARSCIGSKSNPENETANYTPDPELS
jgi:hypothetical protein